MQFTATAKSVRVSPRKARAVAAVVKRLPVPMATDRLQFLAKGAARPIYRTLRSAVANATQTGKIKEEDLKVANIFVDEGIRMKRQDTSHRPGRGGIIQKQTSHIKVILTD